MTTKGNSKAGELRAALKAAGYSTRRVSVRQDHSTLRVTVRDASASLSKISAIAQRFESVRRCEATGEILCGGNTYVEIKYSAELVRPVQAQIAALLAAAPCDQFVSVLGGFRAVKFSGMREEVRIEGPGFEPHNAIAYGIAWAAERIAVAHLDASTEAHESTVCT
jgi:hypothetical protein